MSIDIKEYNDLCDSISNALNINNTLIKDLIEQIKSTTNTPLISQKERDRDLHNRYDLCKRVIIMICLYILNYYLVQYRRKIN
jgi:hypothetical protein